LVAGSNDEDEEVEEATEEEVEGVRVTGMEKKRDGWWKDGGADDWTKDEGRS
jgi:hypothetical protein